MFEKNQLPAMAEFNSRGARFLQLAFCAVLAIYAVARFLQFGTRVMRGFCNLILRVFCNLTIARFLQFYIRYWAVFAIVPSIQLCLI